MRASMSGTSGLIRVAAALAFISLQACAADDGTVPSESLSGADEGAVAAEQITASYSVGTNVETTANLNLRTGPSTSYHVVLVMPTGAHATIVQSAPQHGFYKVRYGSTEGWCYGGYLRVVSAPTSGGGGGTSGSSSAVDVVMARAREGVGFSYWWGGGAWLASGPTSSTRGVCNGSCPSCSHYGHYGADCSGFVAKAWQVPSSNSTLSTNEHPYSTWNFYNTTGNGQWFGISRSNMRRGDALVYNLGGEGHIVLFESGDPWGSMWTYEARGCSYGIVHNIRTAGSYYHAIRRHGL